MTQHVRGAEWSEARGRYVGGVWYEGDTPIEPAGDDYPSMERGGTTALASFRDVMARPAVTGNGRPAATAAPVADHPEWTDPDVAGRHFGGDGAALAAALGAEVRYERGPIFSERLGRNVGGQALRRDGLPPLIRVGTYVNKRLTNETLAHECGHVVCWSWSEAQVEQWTERFCAYWRPRLYGG